MTRSLIDHARVAQGAWHDAPRPGLPPLARHRDVLARHLQTPEAMESETNTGTFGGEVAAVMRRHWLAVAPDAAIAETLQMMRVARLRQLAVVADGVLRGVVSFTTLVDAVLAGRCTRVEEVMSLETETGGSTMAVGEAAVRIARSRTGCLPIVEPGPDGPRLVGLLTESDLLRRAYDPIRPPDSA